MLLQKISNDLQQAMKQKDALRVSALRMFIAAIRNKEISLEKKDAGLSEEEIMQVIRTEVKKRKEAAQEFEKGGRAEMSEKELGEAQILETYLPAELSADELQRLVATAAGEAGAADEHDFGAVMKAVMTAVKGRASGERVAETVRKILRDKGN